MVDNTSPAQLSTGSILCLYINRDGSVVFLTNLSDTSYGISLSQDQI